MKKVRLDPDKTCELWEFFARNLPPTLRAVRRTDGYGAIWAIDVKERSMRSYLPFAEGIARVEEDTVELRYPEYFSDFEDICRKYEKITKREVTLKYWEAK